MGYQRKISVMGLGYVGLPVAVAFGQRQRVIGFDIDVGRIEALQQGWDRTREVSAEELQNASIHFTNDPADLAQADFHIVAVPTPIDAARQPDLSALCRASELLGARLKQGDIVVYESTVYPGVTEEVCQPILERRSGLKGGREFKLGYSPERINPGDREHTFSRIKKVVAGQDEETLNIVAAVYEEVVAAGVHKTPDIRTAEAAKVIENTQRDLNIALVNELAMLFNRMGIDTHEVLAAARTKWNFLPFEPGLVGGHCIGVDPYYLTYKAEQVGYHPEVILAGRRINDNMSRFVVEQIVLRLSKQGQSTPGCQVTVLGITFKEDVPDLRNSKVIDVIRELEGYGMQVRVHDPLADPEETCRDYGLTLTPLEALPPAQIVILAVPHRPYREQGWTLMGRLLGESAGLIVDLKGILAPSECPAGLEFWRL